MVSRVFQGHDWRYGVRHSLLCVVVWSSDPARAAPQREKLAYAMQLGKPIRVVALPGERLPEDLCVGYNDFHVAHCTTPEDTGAQIMTWLEELP
jgi:hypothetical protein